MLEEISEIDSINVTSNNNIEIRRVNRIMKNGIEIVKTYHREVLVPGSDLSAQDAKVVAIATAVWGL